MIQEETEREDGQSEDSASPSEEAVLTPEELQSRNEELETEKRDLQSRLGNQLRVSGEERKKLEQDMTSWSENYAKFYDERDAIKESTIAQLEESLIDVSDDKGATAVLASKAERERLEQEAVDRKGADERQQKQSLDSAKLQATTITGVDVTELSNATTTEEVWSIAGRISREQRDEEISKLREELAPKERTREDDVAEQEASSQTPIQGASAPAPRGREPQQEDAELKTLEERLSRARGRRSKLSLIMSLRRQISTRRAELGLQ